MITTANLGFPRMGIERELKWALERYWRDELGAEQLADVARELRARHWTLQAARGIDRIPCGDFSLYDHVLDTAVTLGAVPERFGAPFDASHHSARALAQYFLMARGGSGVPALELTKWFDTNYHYLVPELAPHQRFAYTSAVTRTHYAEAHALGIVTRPVILGPLTFLRLAKRTDGGPTIELLDALLPAYEAWIADFVEAGATACNSTSPRWCSTSRTTSAPASSAPTNGFTLLPARQSSRSLRTSAHWSGWVCERCARRFARAHQAHECFPAMTLEEYFSTGPPHERPIFDAVQGFLQTLGPVHVEPVSVGIFIKKAGSFVELRPMTKWVAMSFSLDRRLSHPLISRKPIDTGRRIFHVVNLREPADLTVEVQGWLAESYALTE